MLDDESALVSTQSMHPETHVAIIGSGVAGLTCAQRLQAAGARVTIFDKGRFAGGRLATREVGGCRFDHGAQYFTARSASFARVVDPLVGDGVVTRWDGRFEHRGEATNGRTRLVGVPSMRQLSTALSAGLHIVQSTEVTRIHKLSTDPNARYGVSCREADQKETRHGPFHSVFSTAPAPQSAALLEPLHPEMAAQLQRATYSATLSLMVAFDRSLDAPFDARSDPSPDVRWIARNSSKPGNRALPECWVMHASRELSQALFDQATGAQTETLLRLFFDAAKSPPRTPKYAQSHRWRYATVERALGTDCLFDGPKGLGAAGDFCLGPRVELAQQSGLALSMQARKFAG